MRRILVTTVALLALLGACSDDDDDDQSRPETSDGDEATAEQVCAEIEEAVDEGVDVEPTGQEGAELYGDLAEDAPEEVREDFEEVAQLEDVFEDLSEEPDLSEGFEAVTDEDFLEAADAVTEFLEDECEIDLEGIEEESAFEERDPFPGGLLDYVRGAYDEPWVDLVDSAGSGGPTGAVAEMSLGVLDDAVDEVSDEDLIEMCEAVQTYVDEEGEGADPAIEIQGAGSDVLAAAEPSGACEVVR